MAKVLVSESNLTNIANAIRQKNGGSSQYTPAQMADAILAIQTGVEPWEINIIQSANQTISVNTSLSKTGTASYLFGKSTDVPTIVAEVTPDIGYTSGTASVQRNGSTFSVSATAATLINYTITITQSEHQTITVTCNGVSHTTSFTAHYGDTWTATIVADEGYTAGTLSESSGTITQDITISASSAHAAAPEGIVDIAFVGAGKYTMNGFSDAFFVGYNNSLPEGTTTEKEGSLSSANNIITRDFFMQLFTCNHAIETTLPIQGKYINVFTLGQGNTIVKFVSNAFVESESTDEYDNKVLYSCNQDLETGVTSEDISNLPDSTAPLYITIISENELSDEDIMNALSDWD